MEKEIVKERKRVGKDGGRRSRGRREGETGHKESESGVGRWIKWV
jgi:hypothetical protein